MNTDIHYEISYGKASVPIYRVYATPLTGITPIPESTFRGRDNTLFAAEIDVEVFGNNFLSSYTEGDNRQVVATDSMKNFVLRHALTFDGSTLESFLNLLGRQFLATYPQMESLRISGREIPFAGVSVPQSGSTSSGASNVLFKRLHEDFAVSMLDFARDGSDSIITAHQCGCVGLQLFKVTGSSFTRFVHDDYTTLPERSDRPLFIYLDVQWKYADVSAMLSSSLTQYVPAEQVRDVVQVIFHEFVSESIQHLVHEMGLRLLARFPQIAEVSFAGQNRTRDPIVASDTDPKVKVYSDPFPAFGLIKLTLSR
jgi:urate oxidase